MARGQPILMAQFSQIPQPVFDGADRVEALTAAVKDLFEKYPPDDCMPQAVGIPNSAEECRQRCLFAIKSNQRSAIHWAMDTGVPNEELLAVYKLFLT
jgi:hypothetical protein